MFKVFSKVGQRSWSRSKVQNLWYRRKGLIIRITHAKYERLIALGKKLWPMLKPDIEKRLFPSPGRRPVY